MFLNKYRGYESGGAELSKFQPKAKKRALLYHNDRMDRLGTIVQHNQSRRYVS